MRLQVLLVCATIAPFVSCASQPAKLRVLDPSKDPMDYRDSCEVVIVDIREGIRRPIIVYEPNYQKCGLTRPRIPACERELKCDFREFGPVTEAPDLNPEIRRTIDGLCDLTPIFQTFDPCVAPILLSRPGSRRVYFVLHGRIEPYVATEEIRVPNKYYAFFTASRLRQIVPAVGDELEKRKQAGEYAAFGSILAVRIPDRVDAASLAEFRATIIHEAFHVYFQRVPIGDVTPLLPRDYRLDPEYRPNTGALRAQLEHRFTNDEAFRNKVLEESCRLAEARTALERGDRDSAGRAIRQLIELRRTRRAGLTLDELVSESYWEYVEGTAQYVEYCDLRQHLGIDRFSTPATCGDESRPAYFIDTGTDICAIAEALNPTRFRKAVLENQVADLYELLLEIVADDGLTGGPPANEAGGSRAPTLRGHRLSAGPSAEWHEATPLARRE